MLFAKLLRLKKGAYKLGVERKRVVKSVNRFMKSTPGLKTRVFVVMLVKSSTILIERKTRPVLDRFIINEDFI